MKNKNLQKIIIYSFCLAIVFLFSADKVSADETAIAISPSVIKIQAKPPADIWTPFTITNQSNQPVTLTIGYKTFDSQASENGTVVYLKNGTSTTGEDRKIFDKMQVVDTNNISVTTIPLGPKQQMRLRLRITIPENEPSSDYYFSLLFLAKSVQIDQNDLKNSLDNQNSSTSLELGIGINVLLAIGDKEIPQANISSFSTNWIQESGPIPFNLSIFNESSHFITPYGYIFIKNMFGQTVGKIIIPSTIILAGTDRTISSNTNTLSDNSNINPGLKLMWPENFLLGMYTATIVLSLSQGGPTYVRSINFFAFPFGYLTIIILLILIIYLIYLRVKKKLS